MPEPTDLAPEIGLVLYPDCQMSTVHGITDLFTVANHFSRQRGGSTVRITHWAPGSDGDFARAWDSGSGAGAPSLLLVPGRLAAPPDPQVTEEVGPWLARHHECGAILASSCNGAFILAATGLLDGRPATTHWYYADEFRARFPAVRLDSDRMVIEDGDILTAGGMMAWTDLGLRIVDRLLGPTVMIDTSRVMLIDPAGREQQHFKGFLPRLAHGDEAILKVQHWLQANALRAVPVGEMAGQAALEERTFLRRFKAATGLKPIEYVQHLRMGKARELLEFTRRSVDQIAWSVGYADTSAFRRVFARIVGLAPGEYRQRFHSGSEDAVAA